MRTTPSPLPNDMDALQALLVAQEVRHEQLQADQLAVVHRNEQLLAENHRIKAQVLILQEQLNLAIAKRYAASSEQCSPDQIRLFNEAETEVGTEADTAADAEAGVVTIAAHTRQARGRQALPEALPRLEVIHELPEAERYCPHDGAVLVAIGDVISEQLDIVPAQIRVLRHIRKTYACGCGHCIKTAPLPAQPIPKSLASPGLLAHVTVSKYQDALPLYRQERILQRIGVDIPRATLANWMIQVGVLIQPLINLLRDRLLAYDILQMDETSVQVLKEPGKIAQSQSYLWVQRGGPPHQPIVLYDYDPGRGQAVPLRLLEGFTGTLQTDGYDGYDGYNAAVAVGGLTHLGCFAHARRKFDEAIKAQGKHPRGGKAHRGLALIQKLYGVEKVMRHATPEARYAYRLQHAQPILDELRAWLEETLPQVPPQSATGKALNYLHNEWAKLIRYLNDGRLEIDNNRAENAIRPFVIGRKNWLFSDSVRGVKASANLYSLIETAKANGLEPYAYLRRVFAELPKAETVEAIEALLPGDINMNQINSG
jgi:transposase